MHVFWIFIFICLRNFHNPTVDFSNLKLKKTKSKTCPDLNYQAGFLGANRAEMEKQLMIFNYIGDDLETKRKVTSGLNLVLNYGKSIEEAAQFVGLQSFDVDEALFDFINSLEQTEAQLALYLTLKNSVTQLYPTD